MISITIPKESFADLAAIVPKGCHRHDPDALRHADRLRFCPTDPSPLHHLLALAGRKSSTVRDIVLRFADIPETGEVMVSVIDSHEVWPEYTFPADRAGGIHRAATTYNLPETKAAKYVEEVLKAFKWERYRENLHLLTLDDCDWIHDGRACMKVPKGMPWPEAAIPPHCRIQENQKPLRNDLASPVIPCTNAPTGAAAKWLKGSIHAHASRGAFLIVAGDRAHLSMSDWTPT